MDRARESKLLRLQDQVKLQQLKDAAVWKDAFNTEKGKECLALLRREFYDIPTLCVDSNIETQKRAAQRDLVRYIIDQVEYTGE